MTRACMTRRQLLQRATVIFGTLTATRTMAAVCYPDDGGDNSLRKSLHYTESSPDPMQQCVACGFFSEPKGACGSCAIFNGPTNAKGHCDSWATRS